MNAGTLRRGWFLIVLVIAVRCGGTSAVIAEELPAQQVAFFEKQVRPLLVAHCYECHAAEADVLQGGLQLDSRAGWQRGGDSGPAVVPGNPDESLLIEAVLYNNADLQMPPEGRLSDRQIAVLQRWVRDGAIDPRRSSGPVKPQEEIDLEAGRRFWAFRPPAKPALPQVGRSRWPRTPIDHFVLAKLEQAGLAPAAAADRVTWLRRVTFDLIGLPPAPAEIEAFLADTSPTAEQRVVDRLLASPQYGERWGRHWLDLARYADSNGLDENLAHGNAWRYRDYVIDAFNSDKPLDRFLREQLAGDLLPAESEAERIELLIATGFLSLGPKVLAEVDERKMEMDIVDEQISTLGTAVLGLTLGCARCHDHKFDPIAQQDYYRLAGIFKSTKTMDSFTKIARWHENTIATSADRQRLEAHQQQVADTKSQVDELTQAANQRVLDQSEAGFKLPQDPTPLYPEQTQQRLKELRASLEKLEKSTPTLPTAMGVSEGEVTDVAVHIRGSHLNLGQKVSRGFPAVLSHQPAPIEPQSSGRRQLAQWLTRPDHPLTARVLVNRVWRWHFGEGLVASEDNFGIRGQRPSHPQLLDWLAVRLTSDKWSLKQLHRQIVLSATYRSDSRFDAEAAAADPENRLLWRFPLRRLDAEPLRDALLAVSGRLDLRMGGPVLDLKNREFVFNHTSQDNTGYGSQRRSLYLPVIRNHLYDVFQLFDFPDPAVSSGDRRTTTVAPQSLFLMNGDLTKQSAAGLVEKLLAMPGKNDDLRIAELYRLCYGRAPREAETKRALEFLDRHSASADSAEQPGTRDHRRQAWQLLCQTLLMSNEFLYLR